MKISARILPLHFFLASMYIYFFVDILRRFSSGASLAVLLVDIFLIFSAFCLYFQMYRKRISVPANLPIGPIILMITVAFAVVISNLFGLMPSVTIFLISLKVYLLPMLFLVFGMYLYQLIIDSKDGIKIIQGLKTYSYLIMSIGLLQYLFSLFGISFLEPMEHSIHSWGDEEVDLISSGFASSKKYVRILTICSIFTILIADYHNVRIGWFHFFVFLSILISGSREGMVIFILFTAIFLYKNPGYMNIKYRKILLVFLALPLFFIIRYLSELSLLISFIFSINQPLEFLKRIIMLMPIFLIDFTDEFFYFGLGPSRYGVENKFIPGLRETVEPLISDVIPDFNSASLGLITFVDSGAFKLLVDFGYTGIFIMFAMISIVSFTFLSALFARRSSILKLGFSFLAFFWVILFMKGHSVISDVMLSSFFYLLLGLLCVARRYEKKNTNIL